MIKNIAVGFALLLLLLSGSACLSNRENYGVQPVEIFQYVPSPENPETETPPLESDPVPVAPTKTPIKTPTPQSPEVPAPPTPQDLEETVSRTSAVADDDYIAPVSGMVFSAPGIYKIYDNMTYNVDMNGDGKPESLTIRNSTYTEDHLWDGKMVPITSVGEMWIEYGGQRVDLLSEEMSYGAIMLRDDNSAALFISSNDYDQPHTAIFSERNGKLREVDSINLLIEKYDYYSLKLEGSIYYFLGNQYFKGTVGLTKDFTIIHPDGGWFDVERRTSTLLSEYEEQIGVNGTYGYYEYTEEFYDPDGFIYTARIDLPLKLNSNGKYVDAVLQKGTRIRPLKMNIELTRAIIESTDGRLWLLETENYPVSTRSTNYGEKESEEALFNGCIHAGP